MALITYNKQCKCDSTSSTGKLNMETVPTVDGCKVVITMNMGYSCDKCGKPWIQQVTEA